MNNNIESHTLAHNILGGIDYNRPVRWTFYWPDGFSKNFNHIMRFQAMRSGCYVLLDRTGLTHDIPPGWRYAHVVAQEETIIDDEATRG